MTLFLKIFIWSRHFKGSNRRISSVIIRWLLKTFLYFNQMRIGKFPWPRYSILRNSDILSSFWVHKCWKKNYSIYSFSTWWNALITLYWLHNLYLEKVLRVPFIDSQAKQFHFFFVFILWPITPTSIRHYNSKL